MKSIFLKRVKFIFIKVDYEWKSTFINSTQPVFMQSLFIQNNGFIKELNHDTHKRKGGYTHYLLFKLGLETFISSMKKAPYDLNADYKEL